MLEETYQNIFFIYHARWKKLLFGILFTDAAQNAQRLVLGSFDREQFVPGVLECGPDPEQSVGIVVCEHARVCVPAIFTAPCAVLPAADASARTSKTPSWRNEDADNSALLSVRFVLESLLLFRADEPADKSLNCPEVSNCLSSLPLLILQEQQWHVLTHVQPNVDQRPTN
uniref:(northern house mosquito) hypothetical protein n=1 Tax=Culex pipiens TaxID=7175 RepID=A0A8D8FDB1_CULPI